MDKDYVQSVINRIIERKKESNVSPFVALDREVYNEIIKDSKKHLNQLCRDNVISVQKSLNDKIIKLP